MSVAAPTGDGPLDSVLPVASAAASRTGRPLRGRCTVCTGPRSWALWKGVGAAQRRATRSGFGEPDVAETPAVLGLTLPRVLIAPAAFEQGTGLCQATPRRRPAPRPLPGGPVRPPPPSAGRRARWRQQVPRSCLAGGVDLPARSPAPCRFPGLFAVYP